MLMFTATDHQRVASGEITVTWRLWKYPHVKAGRIYATGFGFVKIEDVRIVQVAHVTDADAHEAGLWDAAALVEFARSHTGATVSPETVLHRVQFQYLGDVDPRPPGPALRLDEVEKRLERFDRASPRGPWTLRALRLIEENPRVVARKLAYEMDWGTADFKLHIRKLKALGLTISCEVGYELSESGQSYLDSIGEGTEAMSRGRHD